MFGGLIFIVDALNFLSRYGASLLQLQTRPALDAKRLISRPHKIHTQPLRMLNFLTNPYLL